MGDPSVAGRSSVNRRIKGAVLEAIGNFERSVCPVTRTVEFPGSRSRSLVGWLGSSTTTSRRRFRAGSIGGTEMPVGDLSRENARHECGTLWCVRGTVVRTLGSMGSTLEPSWQFYVHVCMYVCMCVCACPRTRLCADCTPTCRVGVFVCSLREREGEKQRGVGRTKRDREIRRRQVNGGRKREIMVQREDGRIIRALDGRKLEGQRRIARR